MVDVAGNGFNLTNSANGVLFNIDGRSNSEQIAWTAANSDDAWLVLDRNGNGLIDDGKELFGNFTQQPSRSQTEIKNGFRALAVFDKPGRGGNDDGQIDSRDEIFTSLRLWQDSNHNGISEQSELFTLTAKGLAILDLDYKESRRHDQHGNWFKFRAKVKDAQGAQIGRWAWDVYLLIQ